MFTITGTVRGRAVSLTYKDGVLSGDQEAIDIANYENTQKHGYLGLPPSGGESDYLIEDLSAYDLLATHVFDSIASEKNDWRDLEQDPPDMVY